MPRSLVCLLLALLAWPARAQDPPAVAVLPLQKAAASAQYDGLGRALAGMLVSDLAALPALRLVERDQLDALLAELKLGESAFVDPKTAQKLGKGVGARFVVAGSYTVIDPTFAMDARIVEVSTGEIVKAAAAQGTVAEFVAVEKEVVEALVTGLDLTISSSERRKLLLQAPTERFGAFAAWGEALARRAEGRFDEAQAALNRALADDPSFVEAQEALGDLEALIRKREEERQGARQDARQTAFDALLAETTDDRKLPNGFVHDQASLARWALRLGVLEEQGRECERYAEMRSWLARQAWVVKEPARTAADPGVLSYRILQDAKARGLDLRNEDPKAPEHLKDPLASRSAALFRDLGSYVFGSASAYKRGHGLVSSLLACHAGAKALTELDALAADARAAGVHDQRYDRNSVLTVGERLSWWWAVTRARRLGADAELARRTEALLAAHKGDEAGERLVLTLVGEVRTLAENWEDHQVRRRGLPPEEVVRRMELLAKGKLPDDAVCKQFENQRGSAAYWLADHARMVAEGSNGLDARIDRAMGQWAPAADFGCLAGIPPRFKSAEAAWAWMDGASSRRLADAEPTCEGSWVSYAQMLERTRPQRADPMIGPTWLVAADQTLVGLVYSRCVSE